jgi:hypothetical protein
MSSKPADPLGDFLAQAGPARRRTGGSAALPDAGNQRGTCNERGRIERERQPGREHEQVGAQWRPGQIGAEELDCLQARVGADQVFWASQQRRQAQHRRVRHGRTGTEDEGQAELRQVQRMTGEGATVTQAARILKTSRSTALTVARARKQSIYVVYMCRLLA